MSCLDNHKKRKSKKRKQLKKRKSKKRKQLKLKVVKIPPGDPDCCFGGVKIRYGSKQFRVCNGLPGPAGPQGISVRGRPGIPGSIGPQGPAGPGGTFVSAFGEIYQDPDTLATQLVPFNAGFVPFVGFNAVGLSDGTVPAGDAITIPAASAGIYEVSFNVSFSSPDSLANWRFAVGVNGVAVPNIQTWTTSTVISATQVISAPSAEGILFLAAGDVVNLLVAVEGGALGSATLNTYAANLHVTRIQ